MTDIKGMIEEMTEGVNDILESGKALNKQLRYKRDIDIKINLVHINIRRDVNNATTPDGKLLFKNENSRKDEIDTLSLSDETLKEYLIESDVIQDEINDIKLNLERLTNTQKNARVILAYYTSLGE